MLRDVSPRNTPHLPGDPSGGVVYLRIVLSLEQASRMWVFLNKVFYREGLLAPRPTPKLEDHPSSAVRDCFTLLIGGHSSMLSYITLLFILVVTWRIRSPAKTQRVAHRCEVTSQYCFTNRRFSSPLLSTDHSK